MDIVGHGQNMVIIDMAVVINAGSAVLYATVYLSILENLTSMFVLYLQETCVQHHVCSVCGLVWRWY